MIEKLRLDIPVLLPDVTDAADACVSRLIGALQGHPGVEQAHVVAASADAPATVCVHFDSQMMTLSSILVPATIFGLGIGPAVAMHEGSTLLVVFNALRLLAYQDKSA